LRTFYVTLAAAAGLPNLKQDLLTGYKMGDMTYKVHLDGYNQLDYWTGKTEKSARREFFLLRRDGPDGPPGGRLEDAYRREAPWRSR